MMRYWIGFILVIFICGCQSQPYRDPYLASIDNYMERLASLEQGADLPAPPEPQYLRCAGPEDPLHGRIGQG